jgi:His/Glu/Gln/Arg/opine family amino acid ABC transporter permease subunit
MTYQFNWALIWERVPQFLAGAWLDVWVAAVAFVLGCFGGLLIATMRLSGLPLITPVAFGITQVFRAIPGFVMMVWVYIVLGEIGPRLDGVQSMVVALTLGGSAISAEIFRATISAIARDQTEAARALGLGWFDTQIRIVLPQALRIAIPPLGNVFVGQLKGATLMSIVAAEDMVFVARDLNYAYLAPFEGYSTVAVLLVVIVLIASVWIKAAERWLRVP